MLKFQRVTSGDTELIKTMVSWYNDPNIRHLIRPNFTGEADEEYTDDQLKVGLEDKNRYYYVALDDNTPIGEVTITIDAPHLAKKIPASSWISILIGASDCRGKGYGKEMMSFLEYKSRELGLTRIELGVFEFNETAAKFYQKLGYTPFAKFEDFTFWNGSWYGDIRMEKYLDH